MKKDSNNTVFNAKVDIVTSPDNIRFYSSKRDEYTELALTAIKQKASVIKYISPSYKDYSILCEEAINQDYKTFLLINDGTSNYKQLGIKAIIKNPFIVLDLNKEMKYYNFFWELAIAVCYKVLWHIGEDKKELFPLIEKAIQQEPLAISYVDSRISIYNELCNMAYSKNKETIKRMDINFVDEYLVFEILKKEPEKIKDLDNSKDYYKEAWKLVLSIDGKLIKHYYPYTEDNEEENLDALFELIDIAKKNAPEIVNYPIALNALCLRNRQKKEKLLSTLNISENNINKLLKEIDDEYKLLSKKCSEAIWAEIREKKPILFDPIPDCKVKSMK